MRRWIVLLSLVLLLGLAVLAMLFACSGAGTIIMTCTGRHDDVWFGRPPLTVCMRGNDGLGGMNVELYEWDFGDGNTLESLRSEVTHTYDQVGEYEATLIFWFNDGTSKTDTQRVSVAGEPLAAFTYEVYEPTGFSAFWWQTVMNTEPNELEIQFDASSSYPTVGGGNLYVPTLLTWEFGDGMQETAQPSTNWFGGLSGLVIEHLYPSAGVYTVTMTLTDNLGYTDTTTQTITVGTPDDDDDDEVLADDFELGAIFWELDDEDEEDCIYIDGTVQNYAAVPAGVELTATAYNAIGTALGTFTYWPAGATNIGVGVNYAFSFFLCDLSAPGEQVVTVEVVVSDAGVYY